MSKKIALPVLRQVLMRLEGGKITDRAIERDLPVHRKTVAKYRKIYNTLPKETASRLWNAKAELLKEIFEKGSADSHKTKMNANLREVQKQALLENIEVYRKELTRTGVTLYLLWEEYMESPSKGEKYSYPSFCRILKPHLKRSNYTYRNKSSVPGEVLEVDFAGKTIPVTDSRTHHQTDCYLFIAVFSFSQYTYVEALPSTKLSYVLQALCNCLQYFKGVPRSVLSDNMAQVVTTPDRYEPRFTEGALSWANHYGTSFAATAPRSPKQKPHVERHVNLAYQRIYARLRDLTFCSVHELNEQILKKLEMHNDQNFQGRTFSRRSQFILEEFPVLHLLPAVPYKMQKHMRVKVQVNYHAMLGEDKHYYSVPFDLVGSYVEISYDVSIVEIYANHTRVALHQRDPRAHMYTTVNEHMPIAHQKYEQLKGYTRSDFERLSSGVGANTRAYIVKMLDSRFYEQHAYKGCLGVLSLSNKDKYGPQRLEAACAIGLELRSYSYKTIQEILKNNADQKTTPKMEPQAAASHKNLRGPEAFIQTQNTPDGK
jgi:transposase